MVLKMLKELNDNFNSTKKGHINHKKEPVRNKEYRGSKRAIE